MRYLTFKGKETQGADDWLRFTYGSIIRDEDDVRDCKEQASKQASKQAPKQITNLPLASTVVST